MIIKGDWFLPGKLEESEFGELNISDQGVFELKILKTNKKDFFGESRIKFIHGRSNEGQKVTLFDCHRLSVKRLRNHRLDLMINAKYVFIGDDYFNDEKDKFKVIRASILGLSTWKERDIDDEGGLKMYFSEDKVNLSPVAKKPIEIYLNNSVTIRIEDSIVSKLDIDSSGDVIVCYKEFSSLEIELDGWTGWEGLLTKLYWFQLFLILSFQHLTKSSNVKVSTKRINDSQDDEENLVFEVYSAINYIDSNSNRTISRILKLWSYRDIEDRSDLILNEWFSFCEKSNAMIQLFATMFDGSVDNRLETEFLNVVRFLEIYHRKYSKSKRMASGEYRELRNNILSKVEGEAIGFIEKLLEHGNELSLAERLKELFENNSFRHLTFSLEHGGKKIVDIHDISVLIAKERNYLTHLPHRVKLNKDQILSITKRLKLFVLLLVAKKMGVSETVLKGSLFWHI